MVHQDGGEGPAPGAAASAGGADEAAAGLPAPLAQLVEVLEAEHQNPSDVCPQKFLGVLFTAHLAKYEHAEIEMVIPQSTV